MHAIELTEGKEYLVKCRLLPPVRPADLAEVDEYVDTLRRVPHCAEHDRSGRPARWPDLTMMMVNTEGERGQIVRAPAAVAHTST